MSNTSNSHQSGTGNVQCQQLKATDTDTNTNDDTDSKIEPTSCSNNSNSNSSSSSSEKSTEPPPLFEHQSTDDAQTNVLVAVKANVVDLPPPPTPSPSPTSSPSPTPHRRKSSICPDIQVSHSDNSEVKKVYTFCEPNSDSENVGVCKRMYCTEILSCQCCRTSEDTLNTIIKELKKKIEYTERMNWLCLANRPTGPPHRKTSLPKHSDVKKKFLEICDTTLSDEVKAALRLPAFDSYEWADEDVLHLMQTMFMESGFLTKFNIPIATLREWLYEVYKHYNSVPFHNFRHCFCVAQMMYAMAWHTNLFSRLGDLEVLILLVSCICHDLDHPGYNNIYQINARTELALRYNDISPLENHHCSIAFRLLEIPDCNIFKNFDKEQFKQIREGIIRCILATDMARHNEILSQFQEISPNFDYTSQSHLNLLCMILIKVADISNEARPMDIAEPWLERLLQEFFAQSALEKSEGLPVTPFMDPDKISKPGSQVRFIGLVLLPLFEALGELLPELVEFIINPVRVALDYYKRLNDAQNKTRKSLVEGIDGSSEGGSPQLPRSQSGISVRSRRSIPSQKSTSRTSVDEPLCISAELHDLPEDSESGDSETATEVEVAEKASKFKIDTEGNNRKCSQPSSRKGSKEKRPSMISEMYTTSSGSRSRNSYGNIQHGHRSYFGVNRAVSLDQYSRRLSDGVQSSANDDKVMVYNRQHRSLDNEVTGFNMSDKANFKPIPEAVKISVDCDNANDSVADIPPETKIIPTTYTTTSASKSFLSRLRQFTDRLGWTFEKDPKRASTTASIIISTKNNNAESSKTGFCCSLTNRTASMVQQSDAAAAAAITSSTNARNRAMSLDVPIRTQYSCSSSGGGESRKSSRNDDSNHLCEDNNSNHTISENKSNADFGTENGRTSSI